MENQNYKKFKGLYMSEDWDYETPDEFWNFLNEIFGFTLDVASNLYNKKTDVFINEETNALTVEWETDGLWWMNPPWGRKYTKKTGYRISDWMNKALFEFRKGHEGVAVVSARTDTRWWQNYVAEVPYIWFPKGRVAFLLEGEVRHQPNFPSACPIYVKSLEQWQIDKLNKKGDLREKLI